MSPPKIDTNIERQMIREAVDALRHEVDLAEKAPKIDWHFKMSLDDTYNSLHDEGVVDAIVGTGDLDICMNGNGFSSFLRNRPEWKSLSDAYYALFRRTRHLDLQLAWEDLNWYPVREGTLLLHRPSVQTEMDSDDTPAISILEIDAEQDLPLPAMILLPTRERPVHFPRGDVASRTKELSSLIAETWPGEANSSRQSLVRALLASQDVLGHMRHKIPLPSNDSEEIESMKSKESDAFGSSLVIGIAASELTIPSRDHDAGPYERLKPGSVVVGYLSKRHGIRNTSSRKRVPLSLYHRDLGSASALPKAKSALADSLASVLLDDGSVKQAADGISRILDDLMANDKEEIDSIAPDSSAYLQKVDSTLCGWSLV